MNKRKISIILATATIASMGSTIIPRNIEGSTKNEVLLSRAKDNNGVKKDLSNSNPTNGINESAVQRNGLQGEQIQLFSNLYSASVATVGINFDTSSNKLKVTELNNANFSSSKEKQAFVITLLNDNGTVIKKEIYSSADTAQGVIKDFNGLKFNYGDTIQIQAKDLGLWTQGINSSNDYPWNTPTSNESVSYKITATGLQKSEINKIVKPINSEKNKATKSESNIKNSKQVNALQGEQIQLFGNVYGAAEACAGLEFNSKNKKINVEKLSSEAFSNSYMNKAFTITLLNKNGTVLKEKSYSSSDTAENIIKDFNGLSFEYGDMIKIQSNDLAIWTKGMGLSNDYPWNTPTSNESILYKITASGLQKTEINKVVKPTNSKKNKETKSENNIKNSKQVNALQGEQIQLFGNVYGAAEACAGLEFNAVDKKINVEKLSSEAFSNSYINKAFTITILNKNGTVLKEESYNSSDTAENIIKDFNGLSFEYGDTVKVESSDLAIWTKGVGTSDNYPWNSPTSNESVSYEITSSGLKKTENNKKVNPIIKNKIYKLNSNKIIINNVWNQSLGTISFNAIIQKMEFTKGWSEVNPYLKGEAFSIGLYNSDGSLIKSLTANAGESPENALNDIFNNASFSYGDMIKIDYKASSKISISNFNNEKNYEVKKDILVKITKNGLEQCSMPSIKTNPFAILGEGPVDSGVLTGSIDSPNEKVNIIVNNKTFSGTSNSKGEFSIKISDNKGFTNATKILIETNGQLTTCMNPTAIPNLGIEKSIITASGRTYDATYAQKLSFNPATMTIVNSDCGVGSNSFSAQLIDGKIGNVIASCATDTFNAFKSNNNINGAKFQYGDIIAVYESEETELSLGKLSINNRNSKNTLDCTNEFKCFKIIPEGLVAVANKDLTTSKALYTGAKDISITGKANPNTNVTISFGNESKVIKSDSKGEFSLSIPFNELSIGSEIRVFVNNENINILTVQYDTKLICLNTNKIEVLNNEGVPVFNVDFNPVSNKFEAVAYPLDKTYAGAFYGNDLNIKVINPKNGEVIYNFSGNKLNDINSFISQINNKSYNLNDIIEVFYNPNFVTANVYNGKDSIGNSTGKSEYFKITNKGLVNLNNKFINVNKVDILNGSEVTKTSIEGTVNPNSSVEISVNGKVFKGKANSKGEFNIPVIDENGFTSNTNIIVSSDGYIPTTVNPTVNSKDKLMSSYINFYNSKGDYGNLVSSIGFNPGTMKFVINNYSNSFGDGSSKYFNLSLYNMNGNEILKGSINNGSTTELSNLLNNKAFSYGDIIGLSYNNSISKPVVLNGNSAIGNISGQEEYFEITKDGLVKVNFGENAKTSNVYFDENNLVINSTLANGQSEHTLKVNKKLVILNSNNNIVASINTSELNNNPLDTQGIINETILSKLQNGQEYSFALEINNKLYPINVESNIEGNSKYTLEANENNQLEISVAKEKVVNINNSNDINNYVNKLNSDLNKSLISNNNINEIINNSALNNDLTTSAFISTVGKASLDTLANESTAGRNFVNWLLNNKTAMTELLNGPAPNGTYTQALGVWSNIWNKYSNSRNGFNLKLAIAVSLTNATPIKAWPSNGYVGNPVERYNIFETLNAEGGMLPIFNTLDVRHIGYVVDTWVPNNQIVEARNIILQNHNGFINSESNGLNNIAYTINYNEINPHTGASVFKNNFYGSNPIIKDVWYDGGVCGATSKIGSIGCQVFGVPAKPVGQPGHCAFIYYNKYHTWSVGNNIFGWSVSNGSDISGWSKGIATNNNTVNYDLLYEKADTQALAKSNEYLWLAKSDIPYNNKISAIDEAIKIQPLNLGAWLEKINIMKSNSKTTVLEYMNLSNEIISTFKDYPMPMFDTLLQLKNEILLNGTTTEYDNFVTSIENALISVKSPNQIKTAKDMLALMKQYNMVNGASGLTLSSISIKNVWNYNLGDVTFNNITKKMSFTKGWAGTNPYLSGEAFSITLENSSGEKIKSITLVGKEKPENQLNEFFNGQSFNFGDKLVIDYKTSSQITVNNLRTESGIEKVYGVNKPTTIYIENSGLTLINPNNNSKAEFAATKNLSNTNRVNERKSKISNAIKWMNSWF